MWVALQMEVGIEDCLHIEFEYDKGRYHLKDTVVGKIYFLLVSKLRIDTDIITVPCASSIPDLEHLGALPMIGRPLRLTHESAMGFTLSRTCSHMLGLLGVLR